MRFPVRWFVPAVCVWLVAFAPVAAPADAPATVPVEAPAAGLPFRTDGIVTQAMLARVAVAVALALAAAFGAAYLLRRFLLATGVQGGQGRRMQLLEVRRLSPRLTLFMVRVDRRTLVLAQSGEHVAVVDPVTGFDTIAPEDGDER